MCYMLCISTLWSLLRPGVLFFKMHLDVWELNELMDSGCLARAASKLHGVTARSCEWQIRVDARLSVSTCWVMFLVFKVHTETDAALCIE